MGGGAGRLLRGDGGGRSCVVHEKSDDLDFGFERGGGEVKAEIRNCSGEGHL